MKKLIVIVASLLVAVSAHAQLGVTAGITSSQTNLEKAYADINNVTQYHVGVIYKLDLGVVAIQPGIIYNVKGARMDALKDLGLESSLTKMDYKTGYLEIPVQVQAGLDLGVARVYGFAEPFVGYALSNEVTTSIWTEPKQTWDTVKSRLEYGVGLGVGVELIKHVQVAVKYYWNLGDMYGKDITFLGTTKTLAEQKANGISASVALLF